MENTCESPFKFRIMAVLLVSTFLFFTFFFDAEAYDPMDPEGNITIQWDVKELNDDSYTTEVSIFNNQLYRHVEPPGWKLSWDWAGGEFMWGMWGAEATEQGNCSRFKGKLPYCCLKTPVVIDLLPKAPYNFQTRNCCKAGLLASLRQNVVQSVAVFQISVGGGIRPDNSTVTKPENYTLGLPGYTCSKAFDAPPTRYLAATGRRWLQAIQTWKVTCSYSEFLASSAPVCCVSLSAFYNETIIPCPTCSCGCRDSLTSLQCIKPDETSPTLQMPTDMNDVVPPILLCTGHMCPIRVHWHVKVSYKEYWRVKMTVTNLNFVKNYSNWNLVIQHPNLQSIVEVFSFQSSPLLQYGTVNDTSMFWGIQYYNDMLLQHGENGNVQSEMLLRKDPEMFTFKEGWAFPRRILFNGHECVMPQPENFPRLPKMTSKSNGNFNRRFNCNVFLLYRLLVWIVVLL